MLLTLDNDTGGRRVETPLAPDQSVKVLIVPLSPEEAKELGIETPNAALHIWVGPDDDRHQR